MTTATATIPTFDTIEGESHSVPKPAFIKDKEFRSYAIPTHSRTISASELYGPFLPGETVAQAAMRKAAERKTSGG